MKNLSKKLRPRSTTKRRSRAAVPLPRRAITRGEYAELAVRLGAAEMQMQRNRAIVDALSQRVAQLHEQVNALEARVAPSAFGSELPNLPSATTPTVES